MLSSEFSYDESYHKGAHINFNVKTTATKEEEAVSGKYYVKN